MIYSMPISPTSKSRKNASPVIFTVQTPAPIFPSSSPPSTPLPQLLQNLLRLVDLARQIRAPSPIRMVQQHHLPVSFPDIRLRQIPFAVSVSLPLFCPPFLPPPAPTASERHTSVAEPISLLAASSAARTRPCKTVSGTRCLRPAAPYTS